MFAHEAQTQRKRQRHMSLKGRSEVPVQHVPRTWEDAIDEARDAASN